MSMSVWVHNYLYKLIGCAHKIFEGAYKQILALTYSFVYAVYNIIVYLHIIILKWT